MAYTGEKVQVQLVGMDGDAFSIMGRVAQAMHRAGISKEAQEEYHARTTSGDYDNLLRVTLEYVEEPESEYLWDDEEDDSFTCPGCGGLFYESEENPHVLPGGIFCQECYHKPCKCGDQKDPSQDLCETCEDTE